MTAPAHPQDNNPTIDLFNGKQMIDATSYIGTAILVTGAAFTFLVGSGWLAASTVFAGFEYILKITELRNGG